MPRVPGMFNGGVPAPIKWDPNNPPVQNGCSGLVELHAPDCDGSCEKTSVTELMVQMMNEYREWGKLGLDPTRIIGRDTHKMGNQLQALINIVKGLGVTQVELDDEFMRCTIKELQTVRLQHEDEFKRMRLGLSPKGPGVLGPDGKPIG